MGRLLGRELVKIVGEERLVPKFDPERLSPGRKISSPEDHPLISIHRSITGVYVRSPATPFPENYAHEAQDVELTSKEVDALHKLINTMDAIKERDGFNVDPSPSRHKCYFMKDGKKHYVSLLNFSIG